MLFSSNIGTTDLVTWPSKRKLVESMEYTDACHTRWRFHKHSIVLLQILTIWTYIHIFMYNTENKIFLCELQNAISNFQKFCKVFAQQKSKSKSGTFMYKFSRNLCLILNSKIVFKYLLWLKLLVLKKIQYIALNPLLTHTKKQACSF